jgi:sporulation protein YunB
MLINKVCSKTAAEISKEIKASESEKITLPIGIFSGIELLSNIGPKFTVSILQTGNTITDYETSFESQGINQINFKIWLVAKTDINIVNPFYSKKVSVSRKIMLVNTVFNGTVPQTYLNMSKQ